MSRDELKALNDAVNISMTQLSLYATMARNVANTDDAEACLMWAKLATDKAEEVRKLQYMVEHQCRKA